MEGQEAVEALKLYNMASSIVGSRNERKWLDDFPKVLKRAGLQDVKYLAPEPKSSTLQPVMMNWVWALEEGIGFLRGMQGT